MPASNPQETLHISEVAERIGLSLRTVRYYEEQGLFAPAGRTDGGFRLYTQREVDRLLLIKQMKPLRFTVQQMRDLLAAHDALTSPDTDERRVAEQRITEFAEQAAARCEELSDQLARAQEFARQLAAHTPHGSAR
jgi:MerR family transcriptional regulator, copper efflux regulator